MPDLEVIPSNKPSSFLDQARAVASNNKSRVYATWYNVNGDATEEYTYGKLWEDAGTIAHQLRIKWGVQKGEKVVLCYNFGLHFFASFLGCLRAGVVAVLVFPPGPPLTKSLSKLIKVVEDCDPALILTDSTILALKRVDQLNPVSSSRNLWPTNVQYKKTDSLLKKIPQFTRQSKILSFNEDTICLDDLAFLQYTSGSTSLPKAVMVTHGNITANTRLIANGHKHSNDISDTHVGFSWLPQYHDLGLIYASITPFAEGWTMHMMSPISFIKNPLLWIKLVSDKQINWSVAPNFGYKLVVRKFLEAKAKNGGQTPLPGLDLSCVNHFMNCAEPIGLETHQEFTDCFGEYGLRHDWFATGYGLAESVVGVSFQFGNNVSRKRTGEDNSQFVAVGHRKSFDSSLVVKIVDPQTCQEVEDEVTGELWLAGPSKTAGYLGKPELSQEVMQAKLCVANGLASEKEAYLRTGDLAFFQDDHLYVCGRLKDLIIVQGANFYPHDFEYIAQTVPGVRPGCIAAFSPSETADGGGEVHIVFEIRKECEKEALSISVAIRDKVSQGLGLTCNLIVAIKEKTICKTTSGKIQRRRTRQMLQEGLFSVVFALGQSDSFKTGTKPELTQKSNGPVPTDMVDDDLVPEEKYDIIVAKVLGNGYNPSSTWEESGLSSMSMVELTNSLSEHFPVTIPPDFTEKFSTPSSLKGFVLGPSIGAFFPVELEDFNKLSKSAWDKPIPWNLSTALQGMGVFVLFLIFSVSTVPAYHFFTACNKPGLKILLPLLLPVWHISFSILVLLSKWIVIGRYAAKKVSLPSWYFLRWWFVDRLVELWEFFTGRFLLNTPLLWVFYRLMGVNMPSSVTLDAFLREFDLLTIDDSAFIERDIRCRKFGQWEKSWDTGEEKRRHDVVGSPSLRFRPTHVGPGCTIRGHVGLGSTIGEGSHVEKLSSVPEGGQVPAGVTAVGSPAHQSSEPSEPNVTSSLAFSLGAAKLVWILVELYMSACFVIVGEAVFGHLMSSWTWRYATLLRVVFLIAFSTVMGLVACIPLKWVLIGRRRPGGSKTDFQDLCYWLVDYHYGIYIALFDFVGDNTLMVNALLMAMGMDIDFASKVWLTLLPPSKVDLISIKRSFVSAPVLDLVQNGKAQPISIEDSSIGHSLVVAGGTKIRYAEITPFSRVTEDILGDPKKWESYEKLDAPGGRLLVDLAIIPMFLAVTASFIPTYEFFRSDMLASLVPALSFPVLKVALGLVVHCLTWYVCCVLLHWATYPKAMCRKAKDGSRPWSKVLFAVYMEPMADFWELSFLALLWGTPFMNAALTGLGARINGPLWYFGKRIYDIPFLVVHGPTIVDSSWLNGHFAVRGKIEHGKCEISGLLHEGTICLAHTHMKPSNGLAEVGPIHFVSPKPFKFERDDFEDGFANDYTNRTGPLVDGTTSFRDDTEFEV